MNQNDDPKIRELLKKSPTLKPPESFYQGVLDKVERKRGRADETASGLLPLLRSSARWFGGYPVKALASACILMIIVLVTRETKKNQPVLFDQVAHNAIESESRPAPA